MQQQQIFDAADSSLLTWAASSNAIGSRQADNKCDQVHSGSTLNVSLCGRCESKSMYSVRINYTNSYLDKSVLEGAGSGGNGWEVRGRLREEEVKMLAFECTSGRLVAAGWAVASRRCRGPRGWVCPTELEAV